MTKKPVTVDGARRDIPAEVQRACALSALDVESMLRTVSDIVVPAVADFCFFDLLRSEGTLRRTAWKHGDPARAAHFNDVQRMVPPLSLEHHPVAHALLENRPEYVPEVTEAWMIAAASSERHLAFMRSLRMNSLVTIPLAVGERRLGALTFSVTESSGRRYDQESVRLLAEIGERVSIAVDNALLYEDARRQKERYVSLTRALAEIVWTTDPTGRVADIPEWREYTGQSVEETLDVGWLDAIHPDDREATARAWEDAVRTEGDTRYDVHYRIRGADGVYRWFHARGVPVRNPDGSVREWVGVCVDVDARVRAEAALRASESRLRSIFEQAPAAIMITEGSEHRIVSANPIFHQLVGGRHLVDRTVRDAFPEIEGQGLFPILDQVYSSGEPFSAKARQVVWDQGRGEPEEGFVDFVYQPLVGPGGDVFGIMIHAIDVTHQVRALHDVEHARAAAESADLAKSDFLATMSHELRTPLNAMIGYTSLMEMGVPEQLSPPVLRQVRRISLAARHLLQLIEEILTFSRLEAGRESVQLRKVDLDELVEEVQAIMQPLAHEEGLDFHVALAPDAPALKTDPGKLRQVLINLLGNAVKFTEKGGVRLEVRREGDAVTFHVIDTGIGIAPEHRDEIFEPFRQLETERSRRVHGTGLGLGVSRRLTEVMGGRIDLQSEPGRGSTFTVRLPIEPDGGST